MRNMMYKQEIEEVEQRAKALNLTVHAVCRKAGVSYRGTWWRWRRGVTVPNVGKLSVVMRKVKAVIEAEEQRLRARLGGEAA
jgi:hypothetical protein